VALSGSAKRFNDERALVAQQEGLTKMTSKNLNTPCNNERQDNGSRACPGKITREEVAFLAKLSCLSLTDEEADKLAKDLEALVNYSAAVTTTKQGAETEAFRNVNVFRDDTVVASDPAPVLTVAPKTESSYFVVPRVLE
jgi:aspartyl-tRNA(Asn)/glutamyl-tRNA(Gln) amidotransferase subunit C